MSERNPSRRLFLCQAGALSGGLWLAPDALAAVVEGELQLDFRGQLPDGVVFKRPGPAWEQDAEGMLRKVEPDQPRFVKEEGGTIGILIEGAAANLLREVLRSDKKGWHATTAVTLGSEPSADAPDGGKGAFRISRGQPAANSSVDALVESQPWVEYSTASVWLRSTSGTGKWRLRLYDGTTYNGAATVVEVGPKWRRYSLGYAWQLRDTGPKRFSVVFNDPIKPAAVAPFQLNRVNPYEPVSTPLTLDSVQMWGPQYEPGNEASSYVADQRAADELRFPAKLIPTEQAVLTFALPRGGRRGGVILDANGMNGGVLLEYSNSGWLHARVGKIELSGFGDATRDQFVRLEWSSKGVQLLSGERPMTLSVRSTVARDPGPVRVGHSARLGMTERGERPLNRVIGSVGIGRSVGALGVAMLPTVRPVSYLPSFRDDFSNDDLNRINEAGTGGTPDAPVWRSRMRQSRKEVINQEKQIYMDAAFAGTADGPLGVQPFSIKDGILRIKAERADPQRVAPFIWNYQYTSGCITTEMSHWQTYGFFEMRARLPRGKGFWPAFWLLPKRDAWPPEIDVLEGSGARPYGVHCGVLEKPRKGNANTPPGAWIDQFIDTSDGFHTYAVDWTPNNIIFFVDGVKTFEYGPHNIHEDMYMLINLALGSRDPNWIPDPDKTTPLPGYLDIDYVHAFKRAA